MRRPPGSDEALDAGCTCPVLDNGHGAGRGGDGARYGWVISGTCKLHAVGYIGYVDAVGYLLCRECGDESLGDHPECRVWPDALSLGDMCDGCGDGLVQIADVDGVLRLAWRGAGREEGERA
jgi:hypothetical protein